MIADASEKGKARKSKADTKKDAHVEGFPKDDNQITSQPPLKDMDNGEIMDVSKQHHPEEEDTDNRGDDRANRDVSRKKLMGKYILTELSKLNDANREIVKSNETPADVVLEERIKMPYTETWGKSTERSFSPSLIAMLKDKNEKVRIEAIKSLLNIGDKSVCYAFASSMNDESFQVRLRALRGLYKYAGDMAVEYLINALEDSHQDVRRRAVIYLGWLKKKEYVPYITGALSDSSPLVRKVTTYSLGDLKDDSAIPHLIKALDDTDLEVTKGAINALKRITMKSFESDQGSSGETHQERVSRWKEWWKSENKE